MHVNHLREYGRTIQQHMGDIHRKSKRLDYISPKKDHFVEGQVSIRSPLLQKTIN